MGKKLQNLKKSDSGSSLTQDTTGKSLAPPPFQLMASSGSSQLPVQMARKKTSSSPEKIGKPKKMGIYKPGSHGNKKKEQERLNKIYNKVVSGNTHESEHAAGYEPLARNAGGKRGVGERNRKLENKAPAYQEIKEFHRENIGTGNHKEKDESGFNSQEYRDTQHNLLNTEDVSSAIQINQLTYSFQEGTETSGKTEEKQANNSYLNMVKNMDTFLFADNTGDKEIKVSPSARLEMLVSRFASKNRKYPNNYEYHRLKMALLQGTEFEDNDEIFEPFSEEDALKKLNSELGIDDKSDMDIKDEEIKDVEIKDEEKTDDEEKIEVDENLKDEIDID